MKKFILAFLIVLIMSTNALATIELYGKTIITDDDLSIGIWVVGWDFVADITGTIHGGVLYLCTVTHTAAAATEPGVGVDWATVWAVHTGSGGGDVAVSGTPTAGQKVAWTAADTIAGVDYFAGAFSLADGGYKLIDVLPLPAGETITFGQPLYGKYDAGQATICAFKYDADAADAETYFLLGIALNGGVAEATINVWIGYGMIARLDTLGFANADLGKPVWATTTAGGFSATAPAIAGNHVNKVGTAVAATYMLYRFSIDDTKIPASP